MINLINHLLERKSRAKVDKKEPVNTSPSSLLGANAEQTAQDFLKAQGLSILFSNFRCKVGEIDIIARQQQTIVFIEVRYRKNSAYGSPAATVTRSKQKKIIAASQYYLGQNPECSPQNSRYRFDVVQIQPASAADLQKKSKQSQTADHHNNIVFKGLKISWIKNAFAR